MLASSLPLALIQCPPVEVDESVQFDSQGVNVGDNTTFTCTDNSWVLVDSENEGGESQVTCLNNGSWSGEFPACGECYNYVHIHDYTCIN